MWVLRVITGDETHLVVDIFVKEPVTFSSAWLHSTGSVPVSFGASGVEVGEVMSAVTLGGGCSVSSESPLT